MNENTFYRLRGPNIIGSAVFALTGLIINTRYNIPFVWANALLVILSMVFFNVYIWVSNDYYDSPYDIAHVKKGSRNVFCDDPSTRDYKIGLGVMWFSFVAGLVFGLLASPTCFLFALAGMLLAYLYTSPTFRAKSRAGFDWIFHVVWFQITFLPLYLYIFGFDVLWGFSNEHIQFYFVFLFISLYSLLGQINHQIGDYSFDLETEQRTTTVVLGVATTTHVRNVFYLVNAIATIGLCFLNGTIIALGMMIVYTLYYLKKNTRKAADAPSIWLYFFVVDFLVLSPLLLLAFPNFI